MTDPGPLSPTARSRREPTEPVEMSLAEKLACEWEARHDVAARGRIADVAPVQHYLTHTRCEDDLHRPAAGEHHAPHTRQAAPEPGATVPRGLGQWMRWGEEGRPGSPVIPRC